MVGSINGAIIVGVGFIYLLTTSPSTIILLTADLEYSM
jgi:hypothetical protein